MSVRLADRMKSPVGGFRWFQPETNWDLVTACPACQWIFASAVKAIQKHRLANPRFGLATDITTIEHELDTANAMRMMSIKNAESYYVVDSTIGPISSPKLEALLNAKPGVAGGVLPKIVAGAETLVHWMSEGAVPVPPEQANARAATCAGCKWNTENHPGEKKDWSAWFTAPVTAGLRKLLNARKDMGMSTPSDDKLDICHLCSCPLKLKVHIPINDVRLKIQPEVMRSLREEAPWCWIVVEP